MLYQVIEDGEITQSYAMPDHDDTHHIDSAKRGAANGVASLDSGSKIPNIELPGILEKYVISDDLLHSHDAEASTASASYVKLKTITLTGLYPTPSTLRIKFDMKGETVPGFEKVWGRIYKNGAGFGTEQESSSTTYATFSEDLSFAEGDTLEIWGREACIGADICYIENFRVYGTDKLSLANAIINTDIGIADAWNVSNS